MCFFDHIPKTIKITLASRQDAGADLERLKAAEAGEQSCRSWESIILLYLQDTHTHRYIIYIHTLCTWVHRIYTEMCLRYSTNNSHIWSFWLLYEYLIQRPISRHSLPWNVRHVGANPEWRRAAFRGPTSSVFFAY